MKKLHSNRPVTRYRNSRRSYVRTVNNHRNQTGRRQTHAPKNSQQRSRAPKPAAVFWENFCWIITGLAAFFRDLCREIRYRIDHCRSVGKKNQKSKKRKKRKTPVRSSVQRYQADEPAVKTQLLSKGKMIEFGRLVKSGGIAVRRRLPERKDFVRFWLMCLAAFTTFFGFCFTKCSAALDWIRDQCTPLNISVLCPTLLAMQGFFTFIGLNIAYSVLLTEFHTTVLVLHWLSTGYLLVLAATTALAPWYIRKVSGKNLLFIAVAAFLAGTVTAIFAADFYLLLAARLLMAFGHGISLSMALYLAFNRFPAGKRNKAMLIVGSIANAGIGLGCALGGVLTLWRSWHVLFILPLPFLLFSFIGGLRTMTKGEKVQEENEIKWNDSLLTADRLKHPNHFGHLKRFVFAMGVSAPACAKFFLFGFLFLLPLLIQKGMDDSVAVAGFLLLPGAVVCSVAGPFILRYLQKYKKNYLLIPGALLVFLALPIVYFAHFTPESILWTFLVLVLGVTVLAASSFHWILEQPLWPKSDRFIVLLATMQQLAAAAGTIVGAALLTNQSANYLPFKFSSEAVCIFGFHGCIRFYAVSAFLSVILAAVMLLISRKIRKLETDFNQSK